MDMSEHGSTEYADFEVQSFEFSLQLDTNDSGSGRATFESSVEPLEGTGGLDNDEVAELVHLDAAIAPEPEDNFTTLGFLETRATLGINLDSIGDLMRSAPSFANGGEGSVLNIDTGQNPSVETTQLVGTERLMELRSQFFGGGMDHERRSYHFRDLYGRGPGFDPDDDLSAVSRIIIENGGVSGEHHITITGRAVWDIASVEDRGQQFSVLR